MHSIVRRPSVCFMLVGMLALLPLAPPVRAEWLSLLKSSMLFDEGQPDEKTGYRAGSPLSLAMADFNGDGHQDLVLANRRGANGNSFIDGSTVSVLLHRTNSSTLLPALGPYVNYPAGIGANSVAAADVNGDGRPDVIVRNLSDTPGLNGISLLLNTGSPSRFRAPKFYPSPNSAPFLYAGDVNGDGTPEIVVFHDAAGGGTELATFHGSGDSLALVGTTGVLPTTWSIAIEDVTGDGFKDAVLTDGAGGVTCGFESNLYIMPGTSQGTFGPVLGPYVVKTELARMLLTSLDSDGYPDLVGISGCGADTLWIGRGLPGGQFAAAFPVPLPHSASTITAGDLDGDGDMDLVTTTGLSGHWGSVCLIRGNGNLTFATPVLLTGPGSAGAAMLADLNEDGRLDLLTARAEGFDHTVEVLWNDGAGSFITPSFSKLGAQCYREVVGDFNRDGMPDVATSSSGSVVIGLGNGTGAFTQGASVSVTSPGLLLTGDLDRDGKLDLTVQSGTGTFQHLRGNGDGTFTAQQTYAMTIYPRSLVDMTRDGILDIIGSDAVGGLMIRSGTSVGDFNGPQIVVSFSPSVGVAAVQSGDWNRDGLLDVAVAGPNGLAVYLRSTLTTFAPAVVLQSGRAYTELCSGDFNRDGIPDLAARESGTALPIGRGIDVFLGTGAGAFATSAPYGALDPAGYTLDTWDANLDGFPDLVTTSKVIEAGAPSSSSLDILLGNGAGQFGIAASYEVGAVDRSGAAAFVGTGDIDRNGVPDIVSGRDLSDGAQDVFVETLLATPPAFSAAMQSAGFFPTQTNPTHVAVGDLDRDGKLDVVTAAFSATGIAVHRGNGNGSIGAANALAQSWYGSRVRIADMNRDGILDIVGANSAFGPLRVYTMLGVGDLTFGPRTDYAMNVGNDFEIGDMNRDGIPDVVVATSDSVRVLLGTGTGTFSGGAGVFVGSPIYDIDLADLNRDGVLDVVCAKGNAAVLYGTGFGGLGTPTILSAPVTFCQNVCVADLNRDGFPDIVANGNSSYYVVWGAATSPFTTYQLSTLPWTALDMTVAAMAANGVPYLVLNRYAESLEIVSVSATGVLTPLYSCTSSNSPEALTLADMNRDGLLDAISVGSGASLVAINLRALGTATGVEPSEAPAPQEVRLHQNYPNPFNPSTTIRFALPAPERVRLTVHDAQGRLVAVLENRDLPAGEHAVAWRGKNENGQPVASGVYFYRLATDDGTIRSRRMVVVK